eukprot:m.209928 g.209928  ORF g.209928 m.209928 type:complete len:159 (+) comp39733_c0_seq2:867-1343(+)
MRRTRGEHHSKPCGVYQSPFEIPAQWRRHLRVVQREFHIEKRHRQFYPLIPTTRRYAVEHPARGQERMACSARHRRRLCRMQKQVPPSTSLNPSGIVYIRHQSFLDGTVKLFYLPVRLEMVGGRKNLVGLETFGNSFEKTRLELSSAVAQELLGASMT